MNVAVAKYLEEYDKLFGEWHLREQFHVTGEELTRIQKFWNDNSTIASLFSGIPHSESAGFWQIFAVSTVAALAILDRRSKGFVDLVAGK